MATTQSQTPKSYLIDVRTPLEYSTGFLPGAENIEYQLLPAHCTSLSIPKDSNITLYCRSGRRSAIAKAELEALGYNVRDLGSIEMAREVLRAEGGKRVKGEVRGKNVDGSVLKGETERLLEGLRGLD